MLDYDGDAHELGKNLGDDLREGKNTLPLIIAMQRGTPAQIELIKHAIENGDITALADIVAIVKSTGALEATRAAANAEAQRAIAAVQAELKTTDARYQEGTVLKSDVLSLQVRRASAQEGEIGAANAIETARTVWMHLGVCSIAQPHSSIAGLTRAKSRAASRIFSAGTQVTVLLLGETDKARQELDYITTNFPENAEGPDRQHREKQDRPGQRGGEPPVEEVDLEPTREEVLHHAAAGPEVQHRGPVDQRVHEQDRGGVVGRGVSPSKQASTQLACPNFTPFPASPTINTSSFTPRKSTYTGNASMPDVTTPESKSRRPSP